MNVRIELSWTPKVLLAIMMIDAMRGRSSSWTRIRVNLRNVPEGFRPPKETPDLLAILRVNGALRSHVRNKFASGATCIAPEAMVPSDSPGGGALETNPHAEPYQPRRTGRAVYLAEGRAREACARVVKARVV